MADSSPNHDLNTKKPRSTTKSPLRSPLRSPRSPHSSSSSRASPQRIKRRTSPRSPGSQKGGVTSPKFGMSSQHSKLPKKRMNPKLETEDVKFRASLVYKDGICTKRPFRDTSAYMKDVQKFIYHIRSRKIKGSRDTATATVRLLKFVIENVKSTSAQGLLEHVSEVAKMIVKAKPVELCIDNISKRVLHIIRWEFASSERVVQSSVDKLINPSILDAFYKRKVDYTKKINQKSQTEIIKALEELEEEIQQVHETVARKAKDYIHANEIVLTHGHSSTVLAFLKAAAETPRKFSVFVSEDSTTKSGHRMALELAKIKDNHGQCVIETTVITDSAIFAIMSRVNKVVIGTNGVLASGGLLAQSGVFAMSLAAKEHKVPVVVVAGLYKLTPTYFLQDMQEYGNPRCILPYESKIIDKVTVLNPLLDYVPPNLIALYILDVGANAPSYIYKILKEHYTTDDAT